MGCYKIYWKKVRGGDDRCVIVSKFLLPSQVTAALIIR